MVVVKTILASLATAAGVAGTLMFVVFTLAAGANSKPDEARRIVRFAWAMTGGGTLCLIAGIWLIVAGYPVWGGVVGSFPLIAFIVTLLVVAIMSM